MTFEGFPFIVGWELTLACNLRCGHCASSAGLPRPNELTLDEALENIKEVIEMCLEEQELEPERTNKFVGFRELEIVQNA